MSRNNEVKATEVLTRRRLDAIMEDRATHCQQQHKGPHDHAIQMRCNSCQYIRFEATYLNGELALRCPRCNAVAAVFAIRET